MTQTAETLTETMTERELMQNVIDLAERLGYRTYHTFDSRRSAAGFPDLVLVRPPRIVFLELKKHDGKLTRDQEAWLKDIRQAEHVGAYEIRPEHWLDGRIEQMLRPREVGRLDPSEVRHGS